MTEPTRIRAQLQGDKALIRVLMAHEMESGQRRDSAGKVVPAWYIQEVQVALNGKTVLTADWGPAVSKSPFLQFNARGVKTGDRIAVFWKDNRGATRGDETILLAT